ncbi:MAG: [protein-PII] uridylyltransferase [Methylophilaceae bacterium]
MTTLKQSSPKPINSKLMVQSWRNGLKAQQQALEQAFFTHKNTAQLLKTHTKLIEHLLQKIWLEAKLNKHICLIAVGGFGRQELYPYSDIDLLILIPEQVSDSQNQEIEALIGVFWDIGLNVGHSVRNLQECLSEAQRDVTVQTNLLEARLLCGSKIRYATFLAAHQQQLDPCQFLAAKTREQDNRHAKFNDTAYSLEPNIKESPGSLRDLHMILWLAQSQKLGKCWPELAKNKIISQEELRDIKRHEGNLQTLRIRLHYLAKRREDRLLFDFQNELATELGLINTEHRRASEQLMQRYYHSVRYISLINEIILKSFAENLASTQARVTINDRFDTHHNLLEASNHKLFEQSPSAILECFLLLQQLPQLHGLGPQLLRQLQLARKLVTPQFRKAEENKQLFINILSQPNGVNHSLRRMNRYGILGQYIPAFGKIIGQMQHDLFHVYTVDEHILNVLANLRRFVKPELKHEFPLCSQLFSTFDKPHLLYIAALFHDIAKGRGGDHSTLGAIDAKRFCRLHGLTKQDTALVTWLVDAHLQMSKTAQKSDLSDPAVIEQFAKFVKNETRLTALYLLTVADIRGTSPVVWNAWKSRLLESLFVETRRVINDAPFSVKQAIEARQQEAAHKLSKYGLQPQFYQALWQNVGEAYFVRYTSDEITWQSRLLTPHVFTKQPIVRARLSPSGDGIQVMIYARDQDDLFARICNFFDRIAYNIGQAKIYTTMHGYVLNTFIVLDQSGKSVSYSGLLKYIEVELAEKIQSMVPLELPLQGRIHRQVKHMPINTQIRFYNDTGSIYHMLDIVTGDRPGLLANIAFIFLQQGVDLHNAKINTLGNRAEDSFLISAKQNNALTETQLQTIQQSLAQL